MFEEGTDIYLRDKFLSILFQSSTTHNKASSLTYGSKMQTVDNGSHAIDTVLVAEYESDPHECV